MADPRYPDDMDPAQLTADQVGAWRKCELCGYENNQPMVAPSLALIDTPQGQVYVDVIRCKRTEECRQRTLALGRPWPIAREAPSRR